MRRRAHSARALALLTVQPVTATDAVLPRFHFSKPLADGSVIVADRILDARLIVYLARTKAQFDGGHESQRWYVRPVGEGPINRPVSRPFAAFKDAAQAIRDGSWDLISTPADRKPIRVRYWGI